MKRHPLLPSFGYWDYCDELLSAHYFESAVQAGVIRGHYFGEDRGDLFYQRKVIKKAGNAGGEKQHGKEQQRKQVKVSDMKLQTTPRRPRALKAVDEDLYKIPPELLYQKPKRKRSLRKLWSGCMGINSVA